ncbi:hypothetical protein L208DRAFT_1409674 [Tricholoma matsutake]|nr:hypothetical protein L208DRAFT_1409674 [Tricholoma matsutake 945]
MYDCLAIHIQAIQPIQNAEAGPSKVDEHPKQMVKAKPKMAEKEKGKGKGKGKVHEVKPEVMDDTVGRIKTPSSISRRSAGAEETGGGSFNGGNRGVGEEMGGVPIEFCFIVLILLFFLCLSKINLK